MVACKWCKKEMTDQNTTTCTPGLVKFPDGTQMDPIPYHLDGVPKDHRCHDCNVALGGIHHPGCDMECCPKCKGQLISCDCLSTEMEEEEY